MKKHRLYYKITAFLLFIVLAVLPLLFVACSLEDNLATYGYSKAFERTASDALAHIEGDSLDFYIDSSVTGNYLTAVMQAITRADKATQNLRVTANGKSNSPYKITVDWYNYGTDLATCFNVYDANGAITSVIITFYAQRWSNWLYLQAHYNSIACHNVGHAMGLANIDGIYTDTVMSGSAVTTLFVPSFTDFDIANLQWMYDKQ